MKDNGKIFKLLISFIKKMTKDLEKIAKIGIGMIGGFFLLKILEELNKCNYCGCNFKGEEKYCLNCGEKR